VRQYKEDFSTPPF
jgi:hypothetical protein